MFELFYDHDSDNFFNNTVATKKSIKIPFSTIIPYFFFKKPEYNWNSKQKAIMLSSFAYGRFLGPIGGALAGRIGGSTMYGIGIFATALITILSPFFLHVNFYLFVFTTALTGTFEVSLSDPKK